jgi:phasin family protein
MTSPTGGDAAHQRDGTAAVETAAAIETGVGADLSPPKKAAPRPRPAPLPPTALEAVEAAVAATVHVPTTIEPAGGVAGFATGTSHGKPTMENNMEKMMKTAEEFVSFNQGNVEAFMRSGQIWFAGVQDLGKQFVATAQAQFDETVSTFKAMAGVKSLKEAMDLQSSLARTSLDKAVAETGKITDASLKLAEQTLAPLTARMTLAVEKFGRTV